MKVKSITKVVSEIIETDNGEWPTYRRHSADNWEQLIGDSWEGSYSCGDLETAYQAYKNQTNPST